jgi:hypothetical protein
VNSLLKGLSIKNWWRYSPEAYGIAYRAKVPRKALKNEIGVLFELKKFSAPVLTFSSTLPSAKLNY